MKFYMSKPGKEFFEKYQNYFREIDGYPNIADPKNLEIFWDVVDNMDIIQYALFEMKCFEKMPNSIIVALLYAVIAVNVNFWCMFFGIDYKVLNWLRAVRHNAIEEHGAENFYKHWQLEGLKLEVGSRLYAIYKVLPGEFV